MDEKARSASVRFDALLEYVFEVDFISHKVLLKCRNQRPHKSVNLSFTITNIKNKLTDLLEDSPRARLRGQVFFFFITLEPGVE